MLSFLPHLNAALNLISTTLLLLGYRQIRKGRRDVHKRFMIAAFCTSVLFIASYLVYHSQAGILHFEGVGALRIFYFIVLTSHTVLAATVPPMAIITLYRGLHSRFGAHKAIARWTLPVWLYVNVTGVVVYVMLYHAR